MPRSPQSTNRGAFTLTELLCVIAIISVLMAMLLPAVGHAKDYSQRVHCAAKLRNIGQLLTVHAADHVDTYPLAGNIYPGTTDLPDNPANLGDSAITTYDYYTNDGTTVCATALPAALAPAILGHAARNDSWEDVDADISADGPLQSTFLCPSDDQTITHSYNAPPWINNNGSSTFISGWSSYGVNAEVFAWTDEGVNGTTGHSRLRGRASRIPNPSDTMLMCDSYQRIEIWVLSPQLSLADVYLNTGTTVGPSVFDLTRHQNAMNILYADGHAGPVPILTSAGTPTDELHAVSMDKNFP
jgi:prepilin-type N-terminal cleavage/methylation domain-containing protein/prepilin-type processing-associated H-X9-DG protein